MQPGPTTKAKAAQPAGKQRQEISKMRTNYEPFTQKPQAEFDKNLAVLQTYIDEVIKANDRLTQKVNELIPEMVKHHGHMRPLLKTKLTVLGRELHTANGARVAAFAEAYQVTMAEIEALRHTWHGQQRLAKQQQSKEKQEFASLVIDEGTNTYYYMEQVEQTDPNGQVTLVPRKKYISRDHPWVANTLLAASARR